ncbi:SDR family oxidoreductase [Kiloniella litopenaei]|uniref:SDR family oxidoreductase n=1 Tax=Kiloniella litopenaei TaxID=1549748 RepID=UPI003BA97091
MYLVADASGPIGRAVTEQLVGQGQLVRVLTADAACRDLWRGRGVDVNEGDPKHASSWAKALSGVQTLIAILPPFLSEEGLLGAADGYRSALVEALSSGGSDFRADHAQKIKIVLLSAMGAEKEIGWAKILGQLEGELKSCCENLTIIRTAFIMENLASGMAMAKHHSVLPSFFIEKQNYAMVARNDLVSVLVSAALDPLDGYSLLELHGPEAYNLDDIVEAGRNVLNKHIASLSLPENDWLQIMIDQGLDESAALMWRDYYTQMNLGNITSDPNATPIAGESKLSDALFQVWKLMRQKERAAIDPEKKIYEGLV